MVGIWPNGLISPIGLVNCTDVGYLMGGSLRFFGGFMRLPTVFEETQHFVAGRVKVGRSRATGWSVRNRLPPYS